MSAILDAKRYSQLKRAGLVVDDDPLDVVDSLLRHFDRYGTPNKILDENQKLRQALIEAESRVSDAVGRALVLAKQNAQLETTLQTQTECQTPVGQQRNSMNVPSPEILVDRRLEDPNFVACRNERCPREGLHAEGACETSRAKRKRNLNA